MMYDAFQEDIAVLNIYFAEPTVIRKKFYLILKNIFGNIHFSVKDL